jgi:pimeloyl-ACP methyl ester carboxylesterase
MTPIVLVHGGGFDHRCWDLLVPLLDGPVLAVDLPGRGRHPAAPGTVDFAACAVAVAADVDEAGFDEVVLVGHSLAGCSMPAMIGLLGERVCHAVFVGCTVPEDGCSAFDTLDPEVQALARPRAGTDPATAAPRAMDASMARLVVGDDLDDEQVAWCAERLVAEVPGIVFEPVDLSPLRTALPRTWVLTLHDTIVPADKQRRFAGNVGGLVDGTVVDCPVVELDTGHMGMVADPRALAGLIRAATGR